MCGKPRDMDAEVSKYVLCELHNFCRPKFLLCLKSISEFWTGKMTQLLRPETCQKNLWRNISASLKMILFIKNPASPRSKAWDTRLTGRSQEYFFSFSRSLQLDNKSGRWLLSGTFILPLISSCAFEKRTMGWIRPLVICMNTRKMPMTPLSSSISVSEFILFSTAIACAGKTNSPVNQTCVCLHPWRAGGDKEIKSKG